MLGSESLADVLRSRDETSLSKSAQLLADGKVDALISSADTKALMGLARSHVGTLQGLRRPAIAKAFQGINRSFYMLDLGANVDCPPTLLYQFACLGSALAGTDETFSTKNAVNVAILNIGTEANKGKDDLHAAAQLIDAATSFDFVGYLEPNELFTGRADVVVTDGFSGNLVLKTIEGLAGFLRRDLANHELTNNELRELDKRMDPQRYNGALLAGINGVVVKSHGSATKRGFCSAILQGREYVKAGLVQSSARALEL